MARGGNRLRSGTSTFPLPDLTQIAKGAPWPVLGIHIGHNLSENLAPSTRSDFGTYASFTANLRAPGKAIFYLELLAMNRTCSQLRSVQIWASTDKNWPNGAIFREAVAHQILLKRQMHYFLFPSSSPLPLYIKFWNSLKLLMPEVLYHHFLTLRTTFAPSRGI